MDIQSLKTPQNLNPLLEKDQEGSIRSVLERYPKSLDATNDDVIKAGDYFLPYSTGFEIECFYHDNYDINNFKNIPNIIEVDNDAGEQRYRIPSGIIGLNCLYDICYQLKFNSVLSNSGIHYHVDCTDIQEVLSPESIKPFKETILKELDTWNYKGNYNKRECSWFRLNTINGGNYKTIEFRIGEMSFDYNLLFKRIVHVNSIVRWVKLYLVDEWNKKHHPILKYVKDKHIHKVLKNRKKYI